VIWWNIWVLLAMPAIWLAWAMAAFCLAIMSYVWRTGSSADPPDGARAPLSPDEALVLRIVLTVIFALGLVYFMLILRTFSSYGERETGWRRSWLATGHSLAERVRERRRTDDERERGRQREREREHGRRDATERNDREHELDADEKAQSPVMGLGLLGVSGSSANGLTSSSSVQPKVLDQEKGETREPASRRGKISPRL
jgi:hypothetical protein